MECPPPDSPSATSRNSGTRLFWQPPSLERLSELLPAYEINRLIGCGGMGAVYEAFQKSLRRTVAIKILPEAAGADDLQFADRFRHEAFAMARLSHPGIVNVIDAGETHDGLLFFAMEFVDGRDLAHELEARDRFSEAEALVILTQLTEALAYAHDNGIVHRDIKPANILLDPRSRVKVADFGLAKFYGAEQSWLQTRTGTTMGTPDYIAPELRKAGRVADARSDLFSLGVLCYQMLTGELPRGMFKLPSECVPDLDPKWDAIICKALEPKPEDRYQSASELLDDLSSEKGIDLEENADRTGPRSGRKIALFAAVAMLLTLAVVQAIWHQSKPRPISALEKPPFDLNAFRKEIEAANVETQWALLKTKLDELNGSDVTLLRKEEDKVRGRITYLGISNEGKELKDITPVAAASGVLSLFFHDVWVRDLSCLSGMKIEQLGIFQSHFTDLSVLETLPTLWSLNLTNAKGIQDFTPLGKLKLGVLHLNNNPQLTDLSFVREMPLTLLNVRDTGVMDLSPLAGMEIRELECNADIPVTAESLRSLPKLEKINGRPVEEWRKEAELTVTTSPPDNSVDLMPLIDVARDAVSGEWRMNDGRLVVSPSGEIPSQGFPRLELPYAPSGEYDFEVEFEVAGDGSGVYQVLSAQDRSFSWAAGVKLAAGFKAGFERIEGQSVMDRQDGSVMRPTDFLTAGRRHLLKVEVRASTLRGFLGGEPLVQWGKAAESFQLLDLSPRLTLRTPGRLGLAADNRAVTFHRIVVREVSGTNPSAAISDRHGTVDDASAVSSLSDGSLPASDLRNSKGLWVDALQDWIRSRDVSGKERGLEFVPHGGFRVVPKFLDIWFPIDLRSDLVLDGSIRARTKGGMIKLCQRTRGERFGEQTLPICYQAELNGDTIKINRIEGPTRTPLPGCSYRIPGKVDSEREHELEFRAEGTELQLLYNGETVLITRDPAPLPGRLRIVADQGVMIQSLETRMQQNAGEPRSNPEPQTPQACSPGQ